MNGEWEETGGDDFAFIYQHGSEVEDKLFQDKFRKSFSITEQAIKKIPYILYPGLTEEQSQELWHLEQRLLATAKEANESREVTITLRLDEENFKNDSERMAIVLGTDHDTWLMNDAKTYHLIKSTDDVVVVNLHNHPNASTFSSNDIAFFLRYASIKMLVVLSNKGSVEFISKNEDYDFDKASAYLARMARKVAKGRISSDGKLNTKVMTIKEMINISRFWLKDARSFGVTYRKGKANTLGKKGGR